MRRGVLAALAAAAASLSIASASATGAASVGPDSHLPVPRYVSLHSDSANGRHGPGVQHRIDWIYERAGLPLQVTAESGPWRRVRDPDGAETWMHAQNLDARRTIYLKQAATLRRDPHSDSGPVAYLAQGVVGAVTGCEGNWRRVAVGARVGWVENAALWGGDDCSGL
jgi:SH3-like domain-containing protein